MTDTPINLDAVLSDSGVYVYRSRLQRGGALRIHVVSSHRGNETGWAFKTTGGYCGAGRESTYGARGRAVPIISALRGVRKALCTIAPPLQDVTLYTHPEVSKYLRDWRDGNLVLPSGYGKGRSGETPSLVKLARRVQEEAAQIRLVPLGGSDDIGDIVDLAEFVRPGTASGAKRLRREAVDWMEARWRDNEDI